MIVFPNPPQRLWVRSFWIATALITGTLLAALLGFTLGAPWALAGVAWSGVLLSVRRQDSGLPRALYRTWNLQARRVARLADGWLTRLLFFCVTVAGRAGSSFTLGKPARATSGWLPKSTISPEAFASQGARPSASGRGRGWVGPLMGWGGREGHLWSWTLVPLIWLLGLVTTRQKGSLSAQMYTLY